MIFNFELVQLFSVLSLLFTLNMYLFAENNNTFTVIMNNKITLFSCIKLLKYMVFEASV